MLQQGSAVVTGAAVGGGVERDRKARRGLLQLDRQRHGRTARSAAARQRLNLAALDRGTIGVGNLAVWPHDLVHRLRGRPGQAQAQRKDDGQRAAGTPRSAWQRVGAGALANETGFDQLPHDFRAPVSGPAGIHAMP